MYIYPSPKYILERLLLNDGGIEQLILRFQLDAAQQSIMDTESELEKMKQQNQTLRQHNEEKDEEISTLQRNNEELRSTLAHATHKNTELLETTGNSIGELEGKVQALEAQVAQLKSMRMCTKCSKNERDTILMPCMHFLYCSHCVDSVP